MVTSMNVIVWQGRFKVETLYTLQGSAQGTLSVDLMATHLCQHSQEYQKPDLNATSCSSQDHMIQNKGVFGYQIYSLGINIMSTSIQSESTLLVILQEAGLAEALHNDIHNDIKPPFDLIAAIPSVLGALCLNNMGLKWLNNHKAIPVRATYSVTVCIEWNNKGMIWTLPFLRLYALT